MMNKEQKIDQTHFFMKSFPAIRFFFLFEEDTYYVR